MKVLISKSGLRFDVDHMNGPRVAMQETIHDNEKKWKEHADHVNSKFHDDNAVISKNNLYTKYVAKGKKFAYWDKVKKIGTVHNKGERLSY